MIQRGDILANTYQIIDEIGSGGTGIIYLAEHLHLRKKVVVKKIKDHFVGQVNGRVEVDILKRLHHTNLPQVYDFLNIDSSIYTVMDYIEGKDLQKYLDQGYTFPEELVRNWLVDLCEVLWYLHSQNPPILHSDIKPANLMVARTGRIYLIDFNISIDGENSKDVQGISPWYAAPEQYQKAMEVLNGQMSKIVLDGRMDIYSLAATFYRVMTGRLPVIPSDAGVSEDIVNLDIPYSNGLKAVISKAMRPNPSARFQTAEKMLKAVKNTAKMDPLYRWYERIQIGSIFGWLLIMIAGILFIYYGNWQKTVETWQTSYQQLYLSVENEDESQIIAQGTEILNSFSLKGYLNKNEDKKAEIFHVIGDSYFRQESFDQAAEYYKEAWYCDSRNEEYCRDYVITLIRDGRKEDAQQIIDSGASGFSDGENNLIAAEISYAQGDDDAAIESLKFLENIPVTDANKELKKRAGELKAEICEKEDNYEDAVSAMEKVREYDSSREVLRRSGQLAVKAASESSNKTDERYYLNEALYCYSSLNKQEDPSYQDRLNLATVKRALGDYEGSNQILKDLENEFGDKYEIPMWQCYNYLSISKENKNYEKIRGDLKFEYEAARHQYDASGEQNQDMEKLIEIMKKLEK